MKIKLCSKCSKEKLLAKFSKATRSKDGLKTRCKSCDKEYQLQRIHTRDGLVSKIYGDQRSHSKAKGNIMPDYTNLELREWIFSQPNFEELYDAWVISDFATMLIPSCDRLDDYKPYTLDNLQLITWQENYDKGNSDMKNGINNKQSKSVLQLDKNRQLLAEHHSVNQAGRVTGIAFQSISSCCRGKLKSSGGFVWIFA